MRETPDVLVVDDSGIVLKMLAEILSTEGFRVRQADNGRVALERIREARPDLVVLDVMMPEVDGYEVCRSVRRESEYIPILMITAKGELEDLVRGLEVGADDYIAKPFQPMELIARAKNLLRIGALHKRLYAQNLELEAKNQQLSALAHQLDELNKELTFLSVTDGLTRAHNHRYFQDRLKGEFSRASRYGDPLSCVMIDIDHFKKVNDAFGHPVGDRVLIRLVEILKEGIRGEDLVARYGGEEFVLLLPRTDSAKAYRLAERLREAVEADGVALANGERVRFTVSLGVAGFAPDGPIRSADELLQAADAALYQAKADGRNRVALA
ncbi:MAG: diguanylate cyclase [Deltaproteobacteria bacterium]|nr:diguanylate cyclase [Deltaproteobacteria bacterium]